MESEFEKNLQKVKPKGITSEEKNMLWSNITKSLEAEEFIKVHKGNTSGFFNMFHGFKRLRFVVSAIVAGTLLMGSFATAAYADNSRPGDLLFPIDLAVENIQLRLAAEDGQDELRVQFASERLEEVKELLALANIDFEVFETAAKSMSATSTATSTDSTSASTTVSTSASTTDSTSASTTDSATSTDNNSDSSTNSSDDTTENESDDSPTSSYDSGALAKASNAFLVALEYLENTRDSLLADGNETAILAIDAFIDELTVLADSHVSGIERARIVVGDGPNETERVNIAIKATIDDVKTEYKFREVTKNDGSTSSKIALENGETELSLKISKARTVFQIDNADENSDEDENNLQKSNRAKIIGLCYKGESKEIRATDIGSYIKKGAKLGLCEDDSENKIYVCHGENTLRVASASKKAHLAHGDTLGKCEDQDDDNDDDEDYKYYICYRGETKKVDREDKYKYVNKGASVGRCADDDVDDDDDDDMDTTAPTFTGIAVNASSTGAQIAWTTNEATTGKVLFSTSSPVTSSAQKVESNSLAAAHGKDILGLFEKTLYYYIIIATDSEGNIATSSESSFTTLEIPEVDESAPTVTNLFKEATTTEALISFETDEPASSVIWYSTISPVPIGALSMNLSFTELHSYNLTSLLPETTYYFLIETQDASNNSSLEDEDSFITTAIPVLPDTDAPLITNIRETIGSTTALVTFETNEEATSVIYYADSPIVDTSAASSSMNVILSSNHSFNLTGLATSTEYYFIVSATDEALNTATSSEETFETLVQ